MKTIFTELFDKRKLEKRRKEIRVVCDFLNFLKVIDFEFYVKQDLGDNNGKGLLPIDMTPEQIDKLLLGYYEALDSKK